MKQDLIIILDLGSTQNTVIAREIRNFGVYSEIHPHDITAEELQGFENVKGIILNGGENRMVDGKEVTMQVKAGDKVGFGGVQSLHEGWTPKTFVEGWSGVDAIGVDNADAPVEYFNLLGVRVANPAAGELVIKRQGETVTKTIVR